VATKPKKIVLLGGSAGAIEATSTILRAIPPDIPAAFFVVVHLNPTVPSLLAGILARRIQLRVADAFDNTVIEAGTVYVAPPDRHLTIFEDRVRLGRGPRENGFRPAVDPLFRSAAASIGEGVIGVVLTGNLDDGTTGLIAIKQAGGIAIVQDPAEALYPSMPASAIQEATVDYVLPINAIGDRIVALVNESRVQSISIARDITPDIAIGGDVPLSHSERENGHPANLGCPDCGGTLWELKEGELTRYRCRVGHAFSDEALLAAQNESLETALWTAFRALEELHEQAKRIADRMARRGHKVVADRFVKQAEDARRRSAIVRAALEMTQPGDDNVHIG
jgi:two-component system, chemotaxis family, protein-glutamate methylesterase/glutaminase